MHTSDNTHTTYYMYRSPSPHLPVGVKKTINNQISIDELCNGFAVEHVDAQTRLVLKAITTLEYSFNDILKKIQSRISGNVKHEVHKEIAEVKSELASD